jgi:CDP-diacylglycerol--glycerol-3-phosphate 3-phosphatidyltransferase/archaetidylinositol phosphate synthase
MMPILARFRRFYEEHTLPMGRVCLQIGFSADTLTYLSLAFSILAGYLIAQKSLWFGIIAILLVGLADVLDGATARAADTAGPYGMVLDHVTDRYAEWFIWCGVMSSGLVAPLWVFFSLFGMVMASYVRARAEATGKLASCNVGFAGRQEKLGLLLVGLFIQPLVPHLPLLEWAVIAIGLVSHMTAFQRLRYARKMLRPHEAHQDLHHGSGLV